MRALLRTGCLVSALASALLVSPRALAAPPDSARASEAERLFREGRELVRAGDLARACPLFEKSEKLDPAPGTLLSLADCEEKSGDLLHAREHYRLAASGFPARDRRREFATGRARAVEARLAHVTLRLPDDAPEGTVLTAAGVEVAPSELGKPRAANPGELELRVRAPGRQDHVMTVTLADGEARDVVAELGAPEAAPAPAPAPPPAPVAPPAAEAPSSGGTMRTLGLVLLGTGAASLAVGGVSGVLAIGRANTVKDHCDDAYVCDQEGVDAASSGSFLSPLSTVTLIAGAALAGAGAYFYFSSRPSRGKTNKASLAVAPLIGKDGGGIQLWRAF